MLHLKNFGDIYFNLAKEQSFSQNSVLALFSDRNKKIDPLSSYSGIDEQVPPMDGLGEQVVARVCVFVCLCVCVCVFVCVCVCVCCDCVLCIDISGPPVHPHARRLQGAHPLNMKQDDRVPKRTLGVRYRQQGFRPAPKRRISVSPRTAV